MKSNYDVAVEVLEGKWGDGKDRQNRLEGSGYSYSAVQSIVNCLVKDRARRDVPDETRILTVEVDPSRYDGINLKIKTEVNSE